MDSKTIQHSDRVEKYVEAHWPAGVPDECTLLDGDIDCIDRAHYFPGGNYLSPAPAPGRTPRFCDSCSHYIRLLEEAEKAMAN